MTGGAGSPIRSASLSVEDDGREWIPHLPSVIPVKTGIQIQLDPQSEALCFRLGMTKGLSVEDDGRVAFPRFFCHSRENGNPVVLSGSRIKCGMTFPSNSHTSEVWEFEVWEFTQICKPDGLANLG